MPGFTDKLYYDFTHYAASVLTRLLGLDIGTGFNVAELLLSGLIFFTAGAIAFGIAGHRLWVSLLAVLMTATAMDGDTAWLWLWLYSPNIKEPDDATIFFNHAGDACAGAFDWLIPRPNDWYSMHELIPLGYWGWSGTYHSVAGGQLLIVFSILCLVEIFNRPGTNWPWIGALWAILLMLVCSTWGVPLVTLLFLIGATWCIWRKTYPENWRLVVIATSAAIVALVPMLLDLLRMATPPDSSLTAEDHTPWQEFVFQWWPVYAPWALLFFWWSRLHPVVRILLVLTPISYLVVEYTNFGCRMDMTGKCWGYIYGAAWATFIPALLSVRCWTLRGLMATFVVMAGLSACFWVDYYHRSIDWDNVGQLTGQGDMRTDPFKGRIYNIVSRFNHQIMLVGKDTWAYAENPLVANLNYNKTYIAWCNHCMGALHPNSFDVAPLRDEEVNDLYAGKLAEPLQFLRNKNISMVVIWPDDHDDLAVVAKLQQQLAPNFIYVDCRGFKPAADAPQAGVFLARELAARRQPSIALSGDQQKRP